MACIANTRIPVWDYIEVRRLSYSEADLLTSYPTLTTDHIQTWIYAKTYPEEIAAVIHINQAA